MKKRIVFVAAVLLLCTVCAAACANGWGLNGELLNAVSATHDWDGYMRTGNQAEYFAVLGTQEHNALFWLDNEDALRVYTKAVYQPEDDKGAPRLSLEEDGDLILSYGQDESYRFRDCGSCLVLDSARIGDFRLYTDPESLDTDGETLRYWAEDAAGKAYAGIEITLDDFNIRLFPHSTAEVRAKALIRANLESCGWCLGWAAESVSGYYGPLDWGDPLQTDQTGAVPVYSAPFGESAWRAAQGKAAVGLSGACWVLSDYLNADGEGWACVRYFVSPRTQRIGYARCDDLGIDPPVERDHDEPGYSFTRVDAEITADTYLTDDPDVSQFRQIALPAGTQLLCMGLYNADYAYAALEVDKNNRPTDGGAIVWGFVPLRDLKPMEKPHRQDVAEKLVGSWWLEAGGSLAEDHLRFEADGTFLASAYGDETGGMFDDGSYWAKPVSGVWYVTDYSPFENLYWDQPPYELTLLYDDGSALVKGLTVGEDGFGLTDWEGGGGYVRTTADPWDNPGTEEDTNG